MSGSFQEGILHPPQSQNKFPILNVEVSSAPEILHKALLWVVSTWIQSHCKCMSQKELGASWPSEFGK